MQSFCLKFFLILKSHNFLSFSFKFSSFIINEKAIWASNLLEEAEYYREIDVSTGRKLELLTGRAKDKEGLILEYEVPKSWYERHLSKWNDPNWEGAGSTGWFEGGIPKEWLTKVHK